MLVSDFDYELPERLIAQEPAASRDQSRLLVVDRAAKTFNETIFENLPDLLRAGDLLVVNNTRVFPARLIGRRIPIAQSQGEGARVEVFLISRIEPMVWEALVRPGRALLPGTHIRFGDDLTAEVFEWRESGRRVIRFETAEDFDQVIDRIGHTPLPPYIKRDEDLRLDQERYQTVYASARGAIAAPTAGLHFTPVLFDRLRQRQVEVEQITLHVGYGTFQPVRVEEVEQHRVESEAYTITEESAARINQAIREGRRVIAVGTTTTRALESAARMSDLSLEAAGESSSSRRVKEPAKIAAGTAVTDLFIYPGYEFRVLSGLVTNFHLPKSSLLMLVSAFAGRELILSAYRYAVEHEFRFYSYGDAMLIL